MQRLAAFGGFARKRDEEAHEPAQPQEISSADEQSARTAHRRPQRETATLRPTPRFSEQDQLEIPAFLRRKGN